MASSGSHKRGFEPSPLDFQNLLSNTSWEDAICPICLEAPHNCVVLLCSSFSEGCHPFICGTDQSHANCFDRYKISHGASSAAYKNVLDHIAAPGVAFNAFNVKSGGGRPTCPFCRGQVLGWATIDSACRDLNARTRCCEERQCPFVGNYSELQRHVEQEHPNSRPSEIDPVQLQNWESWLQSFDAVDILSTVHADMSNTVTLGDYVLNYEDESSDEYDDFPGDDGNWWSSCILYHVFDNGRPSGHRWRSRSEDTPWPSHDCAPAESSIVPTESKSE